MKEWKITAVNTFLTVAFLGTIGVFAVCNAGILKGLLLSADRSLDGWQESAATVESSFKESVKWRDELIDLYGLSLLALDRDMVGDFEYVKDSDGILQQVDLNSDYAPEYIDSLIGLNEYARSEGIPFIYIAQPDRSAGLPSAQPEVWSAYGQFSKRAGEAAQENGIDCLDVEKLMAVAEQAPSLDAFYFRTDGHGTTYGEFWMAKELVRYLEEKYGVSFYDAETVFDLDHYTIKTYDFLGGASRSSGRYFTKLDQFEIYHPDFETNLSLYDPLKTERRSGSFDDVMLNDYENGNYSEYTYWVTDFGRFTSPYYEYVNLMATADAPDILVICDSTFMSGFSYLALACKRLTVVDPRYFDGTEYLANALALEHYDAIVLTRQSPKLNQSFVSCVSLPKLPGKELTTGDEYGQWIGDQGFCLGIVRNGDLSEWGKWQETWGGIPVSKEDYMVQIAGWAADFANGAPFQEIYLRVGKVILPCGYGRETLDVASTYGLDSLEDTGIDISFPTSYLKNGEVTEASFIAVSADGQYLYEPLTYPIVYID